jgi:cysteinyl-tRNA synthetase
VRYWVHVAPVRLEGDKMSKSKGNMVFVRDALARVSPDGLRLYLLSKHYRRPLDYDEATLIAHDELATTLRELAVPVPRGALPREVSAALDDDLDTPTVLRLLRRYARAEDADRATLAARHIGLRLRAARRATAR